MLTEREKEVAILAIDGLTNKEIAQKLNISPYTVKSHLISIFRKMEVRNRVELMNRIELKG